MTTSFYSNTSRIPLGRLISPIRIAADLLKQRELIASFAKREFAATHRGTLLGLTWVILSPLIMLALFTFVFGYIFHGRFSGAKSETPAEFALALFVGLSFFNCIGQSLTASNGLVLSNAVYVKGARFPVEIIPVSFVLNLLMNLIIALGLCFLGILMIHGFVFSTSIWLLPLIVCITLISLGLAWFLSSLTVFVRDVPSITSPMNMMIMFLSGVFFPITSVPSGVRWFFTINPLAVIIDQARGCFLYGRVPNPLELLVIFIVSTAVAVCGYWFFIRTKPAFADVI